MENICADGYQKELKAAVDKRKAGVNMASINDVAKRAKVAKSTVSLVINNSGYVSEETRRKVEQAIADLNYMPSQLARNLSRNRTNLIGIIIPDIAHPFFGTLVRYLEEALYKQGYKTMLCTTMEKDNMEQEFLNMLKARTMDGIIMGAHSLQQEQYRKLEQPVVAFDRDLGELIPVIQADHRLGGQLAAEVFIQNGCRHVVQVSGAKIVDTPAHEYHTVFEQTLKQQGILVANIEMPHNAFQEEDFRRAAEEVFDTCPEADGVFGADMLILACMKEAGKRGIKVPEQMNLLAYDGTYVTRMGNTAVDAVVQPVEQMAHACVEVMDSLVRGDEVAVRRRVFPVSYQKGETTGNINKNQA